MNDPEVSGPRPTILLVEDDYDTRRMMAHMLASLGEVETAADGEEALDRMVARPPDLVIADVMMPRLDGLEMSRALKSDPRLRSVPVIFVTALGRPGNIIDGINAGARSYLTKPFTPAELLAKARRALEG